MDVEKCEKLAGNMEMDEIESSAQENKVEIGGEKRHREDFSSEQFKIEVNNLGRFSYGVSTQYFHVGKVLHSFFHRVNRN